MPIDIRKFVFTNSAQTTLAAALAADDTELSLISAENFPSLDADGDFSLECDKIFALVLTDVSSGAFEVVYATAISGTTLTIERAKEDTTALDLEVGDTVTHTLTKGFLEQQRDVTTGPSAPTLDVSIDVYDESDAYLSWTASTVDADDELIAYDIYRSDDDTTYSLLASVAPDVLNYADSDTYPDLEVYTYYVVGRACVAGQGIASEIPGVPVSVLALNGIGTDGTGTGGKEMESLITGADIYAEDDARFYGLLANLGGILTIPQEISSGKYYAEFEYLNESSRANGGFRCTVQFNPRGDFWQASQASSSSRYVGFGSYNASGGAPFYPGDGTVDTIAGEEWTPGDVIMIAVDFDNQSVWFGRNGVWVGPVGDEDPETNTSGNWPTDTTFNSLTGMTNHPLACIGFDCDFNEAISVRLSEAYWQYTPPSGFVEWPKLSRRGGVNSGATIDDSANTDAVTGNHIYELCPGAWWFIPRNDPEAIRGDVQSTGKRYFEIELTGDVASVVWGVATDQEPDYSSNPVSVSMELIASDGDGQILDGDHTGTNNYGATNWYSSIDGRTATNVDGGDVLQCAVDFDNSQVYFGVNDYWFDGRDPAANPGGCEISDLGQTGLQPDVRMGVAYHAFLLNTGGVDFRMTMPIGFKAWDDP